MKKLFLFAALLISQSALAQQPIVPLELACPAGSAVLVGHQTLDASTGMFRQNVCVDNNGVVTSPVFGSLPLASDEIQYVSPNGNDTNIGSGPGNAKLTCSAAITAIGSANRGLVIILSGYTGPNCPTTIPNNVTVEDFHGANFPAIRADTETGQYLTVNGEAEASLASWSFWGRHDSPSTTTSAILVTHKISGVMPNSTLASGTFEADAVGAVTPNSGTLTGIEAYTAVRSTGGTFGEVDGYLGSVNIDLASATTNITTAASVRGNAVTNTSTSGATVANAYGGKFAVQNVGTARNYSIFSQGFSLFGYESRGAGIDLENSSGVAVPFVRDLNDTLKLFPESSNGLLLRNSADTTTLLGIGVGGLDQVTGNSFVFTGKCNSSTSPAACGSSSAGAFTIAAAATTATINTSAVSATSVIFVEENQSLGATLGVTCNVGIIGKPIISAVSAGVSFTITIPAALATNPVCMQYTIQ